MSKDKNSKWTPKEKLKLINAASQLSDEELGTFLRREGLHEATLREWQDAATSGLSTANELTRGRKSPEAKRILSLERDLRRKEKAMAEMAAIITLQKKVREIWGGADDDTKEGSGA